MDDEDRQQEQARQQTSQQDQTSTPRPDPTERTREELLREIEHLRRLIEAKLEGHAEFSATRYNDLKALVEQRNDATVQLFNLHLNEARQQLQDQIDASRRASDASLEATTKAIDKAEEAIEKRFDAINAFREQLNDQAQTFLRVDMFHQHVRESQETKQTLQAQIRANHTQLLTLSASETGGRDVAAQARANMATIFAAIATLVAVATLIMALAAGP